MSDQRKTISIDPALLGRTISGSKTKTNSTRKRREKPTTQVNASTLRRALIERIKLKRAEEKKNTVGASSSLSESIDSDKDKEKKAEEPKIQDPNKGEYQSSIDFLDKLAQKRAEERALRKRLSRQPRQPRQPTQSRPSQQIAISTELPSSFTHHTTPKARTFKRYSVEPVNVSQRTHTPTNPVGIVKPSSVPISTQMETNKPKKPQRPLVRPIAAPIHNPISLPSPPPYGNLKAGVKPTFRSYHNRTLRNTRFSIRNQTPQEVEKMRDTVSQKVNSQIKDALPQFQKPMRRIKRRLRNTKTKTFSLGRKGGRVGVLLKNRATRRKVASELTQLRRKKIGEIRQFLRDRDLIRAGTTAPNEVLRAIYEQSILTGNVSNKNKDNLIHNYMATDSL